MRESDGLLAFLKEQLLLTAIDLGSALRRTLILYTIRLEAIASRLEAIPTSNKMLLGWMEAIAIRCVTLRTGHRIAGSGARSSIAR